MVQSRVIAVSAASVLVTAATAQTVITVDTINDVTDFGGARQVGDLPGPDGRVSFREAVIAANNTTGPQAIHFAIPQSDWWNLVDDAAILALEDGPFYITGDETTVDFSTQTDFTGDTNPDGTEVGIYGFEVNGWGTPAIIIAASDCTIRGLGDVMQRDAGIAIWQGHRNRIVGCVTDAIEIDGPNDGPATTNNIIGGTAPEDANIIGSVDITCWSHDNVVIGNTLRTVAVRGSRYCVYPLRNRIGGPTEAERNVISGFGRFSNEGYPIGQGVLVEWAEDTIIEGNYIGTTPDGMSGVSQRGPAGIEVRDGVDTVIKDNLIAGIYVVGVNHHAGVRFGAGIAVTAFNADTPGTVIQGNIIGTDITGQNPIQTLNGIVVSQATGIYFPRNTLVGGLLPGQGNLIAHNVVDGIGVGAVSGETTISGNSIHSNGYVGIDLAVWNPGWDGPTPNDNLDADTRGGNNLQNYPVLTTALVDSSSATVTGSLNSHIDAPYRVEVFASPAANPTGFGEGEVFLGYTDVTTDALGNADFSITSAMPVPDGWVATATATDLLLGETSEFGLALPFIVDTTCSPDLNDDGVLDFFDVSAYLNLFSSGDLAADWNNDGVLDFFDVSSYLNAFSTGCP